MWKIRITSATATTEMLLPTEPLPTWPFGKVADFSNIGSLATRSFKIPSTPETDTFFEGLANFDYDGDLLFREQVLTLLYNEEPVLENAIIAEFRHTGEDYDIILSSDNAILKNKLGAKLSALDTSAIEIIDYDGEANNVLDHDLAYHIAHYSTSEPETIPDLFKLPAVRIEWLFNAIFSQNGLSVRNLSTVDIFSEFDVFTEFRDMFLQLSGRELPPEDRRGDLVIASGTVVWPDTRNLIQFDAIDTRFYKTIYPDYITPGIYPNDIAVEVKFSGDFVFSVDMYWVYDPTFTSLSALFVNHRRGVAGTLIGTYVLLPATDPDPFEYVGEVLVPNMLAGDFVELRLGLNGTLTVPASVGGVSAIEISSTDLRQGPNVKYPVAPNLPDITQLDLLQFVANRFALLVDFETFSDTVVFYNFDGLLNEVDAGNVIDISQYAANAERAQIDRYSEFGRENFYRYDNEAPVAPDAGAGMFTTDQPRPASVDIYKAPISYSQFVGIEYPNLAIFPYIELRDAGAATDAEKYDYQNMKVRVFRSELKDNPLKVEYWARILRVDFQQAFTAYHTGSISTAQNYKRLTIDCDLPFAMVQKLSDKSEKLPIYLNFEHRGRKIEGFFKLNKIDRWSDKNVCRVELQNLL